MRTQCLNWEDLPRKVPISVLGGRPPDVLMDYVGRTSGFWYQGVLEPLDELVEGIEEDFQPRMLEASRLPGPDGSRRLHAVPLCGWVQVLALNRACLGFAGPGPPAARSRGSSLGELGPVRGGTGGGGEPRGHSAGDAVCQRAG